MPLDLNQMRPKERLLVLQLLEALFHVRTLAELVRSTERILTRLTSADCMALCASRLGQPTQEDWLVANMPEVYFARYADWKPKDLIRGANEQHPNQVLRDEDIASRKVLVSSFVYQVGLEVKLPIEQVMSVYLTQAGWEGNGGFSAYRLKPRPFSDRERAILQHIAPYLAEAIRRCQVLVERELTHRLLETQTKGQKTALLVLTAHGEVAQRMGPVSHVLDKWFSAFERGASGLPLPLEQKLKAVMNHGLILETRTFSWELEGEGENLKMGLSPVLPPMGREQYWQLRLQEVTQPQLLTWLKVLTPKQVEIANLLHQGLSDKEIAQKIFNKDGENNSPGTVKKHLGKIYERLKRFGVHNRADFMARAHLPSQKGEDEE